MLCAISSNLAKNLLVSANVLFFGKKLSEELLRSLLNNKSVLFLIELIFDPIEFLTENSYLLIEAFLDLAGGSSALKMFLKPLWAYVVLGPRGEKRLSLVLGEKGLLIWLPLKSIFDFLGIFPIFIIMSSLSHSDSIISSFDVFW